MADFSQEKKYKYSWENSKFKDVLFEGNNISNLVNDAGYAITGSNRFIGNQTIIGDVTLSGSLFATGSNTLTGPTTIIGNLNQLGDYIHTGSVYHSGSKFLVGIFSQTGSMSISGSTTQVGNNTLLGNTTLSGSIIISGSTTTPSTPSIKIYGDMETNGVIKFDPVVKNIDSSISASYIFVSGSTNDLYFSQNGEGYNNVTRLRWLEGNLYTGLLNGGILSTGSSTTFNLTSGSGIVVNLNASLKSNPFPTIQYVNWGNYTNQSLTYRTSSIQTFIGIDGSGNIIQQTDPWTDGQYNTSISIGTILHQNTSSINGTISYPNVAYGWKQRSYDFVKAFGPLKLSGYVIYPSSSLGLTVGSGTAFADGRNYQTDPNNPSYITDSGTNVSKIFRYYVSASTYNQDTNGGVGYTSINPTLYNNNGVLTSVPSNKPWSNQRVFYYPNSVTKGIVVYYGNAVYASDTEAIANLQYESFQETPNTQQNAIYLGAITIKYNGSFTNPNEYKILPGGIFRSVGGSGGGGNISSTLSGLSDVSITGPTNGQPLVYYTSSLKWENSSTLTANLVGNASTSTSASFASTASYVLNAVSSSFASTSSRVNTLNQNVIITGSLAIGTGSIGNGENNLLLGPAPAGGTGEGGQIALLAVGGTYTSSSFIDNYQNQIRILSGPGATSNVGVMAIDLGTRNATFQGAVTASGFNGLPNDYLYVTRNIDQTIVSGNWANRDVIFNNSVVSKGISYNTGTGLASLTGGKVYRITARLAWGAAATYLFQFSCYNSSNIIIGPTVEMVQSTNGTNNISDGTLDFIYAPGSNVDIKIRTTGNTTALSGEFIRGDLNTQFIIQQIA